MAYINGKNILFSGNSVYESIVELGNAYITAELTKRAQLKPEKAESLAWLEANGDPDKFYVLEDKNDPNYGYIYSCIYVAGKTNYKNWLRASTVSADPNSAVYNGVGYKERTMLDDYLGTDEELEGVFASGFIPVEHGDIIRFKNCQLIKGNSNHRIWFYKADGTHLHNNTRQVTVLTAWGGVYDGDNLIEVNTTMPSSLATNANWKNFPQELKYIRVTGAYLGADSIITVNEEITGSEEDDGSYQWENTGFAFISAGYEPQIQALQKQAKAHDESISELETTTEAHEVAIEKVETTVEELEETAKDVKERISNVENITASLLDYKYSNNHIDAATKQTGMLHLNGAIYTGGSYDAYCYFENYIPVEEGDVLSLQWTDPGAGTRYWTGAADYTKSYLLSRVVAYDENKNVLSSLGASNQKTFTVPAGVKFIRITFQVSLTGEGFNAAVVKNATSVMPYEEYGECKILIKEECIPNLSSERVVEAFLPDEICCAVGRTIEIYNAQVCSLAEKYHFQWDCRIGKALKRKFSITGTQSLVGNYPLSLTIYDDALNPLFAKTVTLKIVSALSVSKSICPIGDSLTNGKHWLNEVRTLSDNNITFVGTRGNTEGLKHEGRSGWSSTSYLGATAYSYESEGVHPFWDSTNACFSWSHYKTTTGLSPNAVQIFLGTNDFAGNVSPETFTANIKQMVDSIRATDASLPIFIVLTICWGNQNGIGAQTSSDGFASQQGRFKYDLDLKTINGVKALYEGLKDYSGLYFVPLTECHDSEYNFGAVETLVNPRATQKEFMPTEAVHPQKQGYEQMADVMYSVYCRAFA